MSAVSGVGPTPYFPVINDVKKPAVNQQPQPPAVQPVAKDADGDNDGSVGKNIDVRA